MPGFFFEASLIWKMAITDMIAKLWAWKKNHKHLQNSLIFVTCKIIIYAPMSIGPIGIIWFIDWKRGKIAIISKRLGTWWWKLDQWKYLWWWHRSFYIRGHVSINVGNGFAVATLKLNKRNIQSRINTRSRFFFACD